MARQKMLKMRVDMGAILWVGQTMTPVNRYRFREDQYPIFYALRLYERYAKVTGCKMVERPPIELLATMGIKVTDSGEPGAYTNPVRHSRYNVIGCRLEEYTQELLDRSNVELDPMVVEHIKESNLVSNDDVSPMLKPFDEPIFVMPKQLELPRIILSEEEDWIVV